MQQHRSPARALLVTASLIAVALIPGTAVSAAPKDANVGPLGHFKHIVVIYEKNHSSDNLSGTWGWAKGEPSDGSTSTTGSNPQLARDGRTYAGLSPLAVNFT